ncbi:MAG TPA: protein kinase, partial [Frankiaceae bacterium]|nr:protein kinase [Frankiaceae bacterium]
PVSVSSDVDTGARTPPSLAGFGPLTLIGRGRRAAVYRSRERAFACDVAIRILEVSDLSADEQRRFERDSKAIVSLSSHPNIVKVFGTGSTPDGRPYLVMDYLDQGSLGDRIRQHGAIPVDEAVHIGRELLGAIDAAHEIGLLHGDIKPDNVLLSQLSGPQLTDFGIASIPSQDGPAAGFPCIAPEVLNGEAATTVSDVYSLGATLAALITAAPPGGDQLPGSLEAAGASAELSGVIAKAMDATPARRYQGAPEFLDALSHVPESGSQRARAMVAGTSPAGALVPAASTQGWAVPPASYQGESRTNRWAILGLAAAVLVAAVGTAIAVWPSSKSHPPQAAAAPPPAPIVTPTAQATSSVPVPVVSKPSCTGRTCTFTLAADQSGAQGLTWQFGDGQATTASSRVSHEYAKAGSFTAYLVDASGAQTARSKGVPVRIKNLQRTVKVRSGGAGSLAVLTTVAGPSQCLPVGYTMERKQGSWKYVRSGHLNSAITTIHVPKTGKYRIKIAESDTSGGFCAGAVTRGIAVRPAAHVSNPPAAQPQPPAAQYTPPATTQTPPPAQYTPPPAQSSPPPTKFTPPPISITPSPINS